MTYQQRVWRAHPGAYAYTYGPRGWRIIKLDNDNQLVTLGEGRSERAAWKDAALRMRSAAHDKS